MLHDVPHLELEQHVAFAAAAALVPHAGDLEKLVAAAVDRELEQRRNGAPASSDN